MRRYPKVGSRVRVVAGEYEGRQARTRKTRDGGGRIELDLLGGTHKLGVTVRLEDIELDTDRRIHKLPPLPLASGDRLYSLTGLVFPMGHFMTVQCVDGGLLKVTSDYGAPHTIQPREGFEKRWAHLDGHPIEWRHA